VNTTSQRHVGEKSGGAGDAEELGGYLPGLGRFEAVEGAEAGEEPGAVEGGGYLLAGRGDSVGGSGDAVDTTMKVAAHAVLLG
jgi:hypothetical protein